MDNKITAFNSWSIQNSIFQSMEKCGFARFKVIGKSMQPIIRRGDWVIIQPRSGKNHLRIGDIVLIKTKESFIVHRIIRLDGQIVITQGDWSRIIDPPNQPHEILGKVIIIEKTSCQVKLSNPIIHFIDQLVFTLLRCSKSFFRKGIFNEINKHPH